MDTYDSHVAPTDPVEPPYPLGTLVEVVDVKDARWISVVGRMGYISHWDVFPGHYYVRFVDGGSFDLADVVVEPLTKRNRCRLVNHMAVHLVEANYEPAYLPLMTVRDWVLARKVRRRQCEAMLDALATFDAESGWYIADYWPVAGVQAGGEATA